jgi:hypothetical protein
VVAAGGSIVTREEAAVFSSVSEARVMPISLPKALAVKVLLPVYSRKIVKPGCTMQQDPERFRTGNNVFYSAASVPKVRDTVRAFLPNRTPKEPEDEHVETPSSINENIKKSYITYNPGNPGIFYFCIAITL